MATYRFVLTETLGGRPLAADDMHGYLSHLLSVPAVIDRREAAALVSINASEGDGDTADEMARMVSRSRALVFEWRQQPSFQLEVDYWHSFFEDHPDAEFPLHWANVDWWMDENGTDTAPDLLARKAIACFGESASEDAARVAIHDLMYWFAHKNRVLSDGMLVALGIALGLIDPASGGADLTSLWDVAYPKDMHEVAERDGTTGRSLPVAKLVPPAHPYPESYARLIARMRKKPAYKLIAQAAAARVQNLGNLRP